jgi:hypothetical protein
MPGQPQQPIMQPFQGMGMPSPEEMQNPTMPQTAPVNPPSLGTIQTGFGALSPQQVSNLEAAGIKVPVLKETPEQKDARALELYKQKQDLKNSKSLSIPTSKTISTNQAIVSASNNLIPQIDNLIAMNVPNQLINMSPNQQKVYEATTNALADSLMTVNNWPKTDQALEMAKSMVKRGRFESDHSYKLRLADLKKEVYSRGQNANSILSGNNVALNPASNGMTTGQNDMSHLSDEQLQAIAGGG